MTPRPFSVSSVSGLSTTSAHSGTGPAIKPTETYKKQDNPSKSNLDISGVFANYAKTRKVSVEGPLSPTTNDDRKPGRIDWWTRVANRVEITIKQKSACLPPRYVNIEVLFI